MDAWLRTFCHQLRLTERDQQWPFSGQSIPLRRMRSGTWLEDFDRVAVNDANDLPGEVCRESDVHQQDF
jgi:hypothetical protein